MSQNTVTPFVLIFQGRCGSTYLMEALGSHPDITCCLEHLATMKRRKRTAEDQLQWARKFLLEGEGTEARARGFKTKLKDVLDLNGFSELLRDVGARIIHLQRRNTIKATVSFFNSVRLRETTGDYNLYEDPKDLPPIIIDPQKFELWLRGIEQTAVQELAFVQELQLPTLDLYYEDLLLDESEVFTQIFSFLSVDAHSIQGRAIKSTSDRLQDSVGNFDELRRRYVGTPHEKMFHEVLIGG